MFPEGENEGLYHTADATLWFFHALDRYLDVTGDRDTLRAAAADAASTSSSTTCAGTRFGIGVDPADGLLRQGAEGYQLTWMDAKVDDWVVTPRRGKAVEINALWYNALRLLERLAAARQGDDAAARRSAAHAERARESFNARFWYERARLPLRRRRRRAAATTRPAGPTRSSPSRCRTRCSTARAGQPVLDVGARRSC